MQEYVVTDGAGGLANAFVELQGTFAKVPPAPKDPVVIRQGGCIYTPDRDVWETVATAAQGQGPITYTLRGVDASGRLGESASRELIVSEEPITGGLYY